MQARRNPNILVTGTPGTGKTTLCQMLTASISIQHLVIGDIVREHECHDGIDEVYDTFLLDEDKLCNVMEPILEAGGILADFHTCDIFPEDWFDLVIVLRANNTVLYDRLAARSYSQAKIQENIECEIMQIVLEDAHNAFPTEKIVELLSETVEDLDNAVSFVSKWYLERCLS